MGANIDAVSTAESYGIASDRAVEYRADGVGTMKNFDVVSKTVSCVREARPIKANWKKDIEEYTRKRK